ATERHLSPSVLLVQRLAGLAHAMVLFVIASGLSLIFGVTRVVNFAHGSFYMLAAYLAYTLAGALPLGGVSFYVAVALAALAVGAVGTLVEIALLRRVYRAPELYQLLLTFALVLVVSDVVKLVWGGENRTGPSPRRSSWSASAAWARCRRRCSPPSSSALSTPSVCSCCRAPHWCSRSW